MLTPGDVVVVRAVKQQDLWDDKEQSDKKLEAEVPQGTQLFRLEQEPELQGALVSIDPRRQYLVAMVGGYATVTLMNSFGWSSVAIYGVLLLGYGSFVFGRPQAT